MPTLNIIGCGRAARTLAQLWHQAGVFDVCDVLTQSMSSARESVAFIGAGHAVEALAGMQAADFWMLGVPDTQIEAAAQALWQSGLLRPGDAVFHLSGFTASTVLAKQSPEAEENTVRIASAHPVLSFADPARTVRQFAGTLVGIEGEPTLCQDLHAAFSAIGGQGFELLAEHKPLYHAGSVFAANFLVVIMDVAQRLYLQGGVSPEVASKLMEPLARKALDNVLLNGRAALTGPAARGDHAVVQAQGQAVRHWNADAGEAYAALSRLAMEMAKR